jgi:hypothetical protein
LSRCISAGDNRPNDAPIRLRRTVMTLSTAIHDARSKDNPGDGSISSPITGASLATLVNGRDRHAVQRAEHVRLDNDGRARLSRVVAGAIGDRYDITSSNWLTLSTQSIMFSARSATFTRSH